MKRPIFRQISKNSFGIFADGGGVFSFSEHESDGQEIVSESAPANCEKSQRKRPRVVSSFLFRIAWFLPRKL
jgi:hypothetical protein